jgi:trimethylamine--corrinoid protein Co-methyltransferase
LPALAGANVIYGLGMLEMGITFDFAQLVIDNEIAEMIKYAVRGIDISDYNMATEVIKEVGIGGEFVTHGHTFDNFRTAQSHSELFDRGMREGWATMGGKDLLERATEKAKWVLENHKPDPLPPGSEAFMEDIIAEAAEEEGV